jgi:hypothetical protein
VFGLGLPFDFRYGEPDERLAEFPDIHRMPPYPPHATPPLRFSRPIVLTLFPIRRHEGTSFLYSPSPYASLTNAQKMSAQLIADFAQHVKHC